MFYVQGNAIVLYNLFYVRAKKHLCCPLFAIFRLKGLGANGCAPKTDVIMFCTPREAAIDPCRIYYFIVPPRGQSW